MTHLTVHRFDLISRALGLAAKANERLVLICLIHHIRTSGRQARLTWVKIDTICEEVQMPRRNVRRHLDALEEMGAIQRWRQPNSYLYRIPPTWNEVEVDASASSRMVR